jgi:uncharacterized protein YkwD
MGGVSHLRHLLIWTPAILACAWTCALLDTVAGQTASATPLTGPIARIATRADAKARHRSHSACASSNRRRHERSSRNDTARRADTSKPGTACRSHEARTRSTGRAHERRRRHTATPKAPASPAPTGPSPASVIAGVLARTCEDTELRPEPGNLQAIDAATLCLVNQERARNNELPLTANAQLAQAAQGHSEEMVSDDYFAHVSPSGLTPVERIQATGYIPSTEVGYTLGENIAWGTLQLSTPSAIVAAWIASPEHLANILYAPYRDTAVGAVAAAPASLSEGQPGAVYSQEFGVIAE